MKNRIYKFDNLKFFLILFVVIGHFADMYVKDYRIMKSVFIYFYSFHMPLFLFLTGLFQRRINNFKDISIKKIIIYIFLIYFMKILIFYLSSHFDFNYTFELLSGSEVYWYLSVIIMYMLIGPIINKIKFSYLFVFSIVLALFVGYDSSINDYLYLSRAVVFFPFYLLGHQYSNNKEVILNVCNKKILKFISLIIILFFSYFCFFKLNDIYKYRMLFTGKNPYSYFTEFTCTYKHRMFTYFISFIVGFSFMCIVPSRKIKVISNMGKRTLQVYVLHQPCLIFLRGIGLFDLLKDDFGSYFIIFGILITLIITFFLSLRCFDKIFSYVKENMFVKDIE
jgi:fucose 4-O-acetylase-like acetyltransferase